MEKEFHELAFYTLSHKSEAFIHQHIVDAYAAQTADLHTKPITVVFALVGLFLHLEKGFTGKEVQLFHMKMVDNKRNWPNISLPDNRGAIQISNVLAVPPGPKRDEIIHSWCLSVWDAYIESKSVIIALVESYLISGGP
jgi:hypothetical protein